MAELCHRCHGELPQTPAVARGTYTGLEPDAMLFCPHCSAPQIRLPEHMQPLAVVPAGTATTGLLPPPNPREIDWPVALRSAATVAILGAALSAIGTVSAFFSFISTLWLFSCAGLALGLYRRRLPNAWMDARTGLRIGVAGVLLAFVALGPVTAVSGVVRRFGTHTMDAVDRQSVEDNRQVQTRFGDWLKQSGQSDDLQKQWAQIAASGQMNAPELRAGSTLFMYGLGGGLLVLFCALSGAIAGAFGAQRRRLARDA